MYNPFKFYYTIIEYKNPKGETVFVARYLCDFLVWTNWFFMEDTYINQCGELNFCEEYGSYPTLDAAKDAVEKRKARLIDQTQSEFKKSAIHYVE